MEKPRIRKEVVFFKVTEAQRATLEKEAERRGRTLASLLQVLVHNATEGFTAFDEADRPMVSVSPGSTEIAA